MELHGGTIAATSEGLGKGSCFTVEVPVLSPLSDIETVGPAVSTRETFPVDYYPSKTWRYYSCLRSCLESSCLVTYQALIRKSSRVADSTGVSCKRTPMHLTEGLAAILPTLVSKVERHSDQVNHRKSRDLNDMEKNVIEFTNDRKSRILIVDDVPMNRKMLKRLVMDRFDEFMEAENGQQAVDLVKDAMESGVHYDIITMDYQMPVMDGVTATSTMRAIGYTGRIIGITGNAMQEDLNSFISSGADVVLTKPLSVAKIDEYLTTPL